MCICCVGKVGVGQRRRSSRVARIRSCDLSFLRSSVSLLSFVLPCSRTQVTDIADSEPGFGKSDPYVTFYLEKDKRLFDKGYGKQASTKKKNDLNPVYGETFAFSSIESMKNMVLYLKLMDDDTGIDDRLGKAQLALEGLGITETPKEVVVPIDKKKAKIYLKLSFTK